MEQFRHRMYRVVEAFLLQLYSSFIEWYKNLQQLCNCWVATFFFFAVVTILTTPLTLKSVPVWMINYMGTLCMDSINSIPCLWLQGRLAYGEPQ